MNLAAENKENHMDAVVIGTFTAVGLTILIGIYAAYRFFKILSSNDDPE